MSDKEQEVKEKIKKVHEILSECEKLATEGNFEFSLSVAYGMGGYFIPKNMMEEEGYEEELSELGENDLGAWMASSRFC